MKEEQNLFDMKHIIIKQETLNKSQKVVENSQQTVKIIDFIKIV